VYLNAKPVWPRFVIQSSAGMLGVLYGVIISNKPNMARYYDLGPEYTLGRIARDEILQWSSDEDISTQVK